MKKRIIIILSAILVFCALLCACANTLGASPDTDETQQASEKSAELRIKELEAQIIALMQSQQLSETERKKEIATLNEEIARLKGSDSTEATTQTPTESAASTSFKYTLDAGKAIITEITVSGESVTVPSTIDGYQVYSIGSEALRSQSVNSVIISNGIEKLDWFAFKGCTALSSVSIPNSVSSIGYGAFDNTSKSLTILCSRDSFAHKYAQSYGLTYDIT